MSELSKLPNIGKVLEQQLSQVGIENATQLKLLGSKQSWLNIRSIDPSVCYNCLCALEGAIQGVRWHYLEDDTKKVIRKHIHSYLSDFF